jgi:hypothetical protein
MNERNQKKKKKKKERNPTAADAEDARVGRRRTAAVFEERIPNLDPSPIQ